jgi:hypothetical protein
MESKRKRVYEIQWQSYMKPDLQMLLNVSRDEPPIERETTRHAGRLLALQLKLTIWG